jgi:hypothetical protein
MQYYQAIISSETTQQGLRILDRLLTKQLAFGGPVFNGPSKFLWNFKASAVPGGMQKDELLIDEHDYCFAVTYTGKISSSVLSKRQRTCRLKRCA